MTEKRQKTAEKKPDIYKFISFQRIMPLSLIKLSVVAVNSF